MIEVETTIKRSSFFSPVDMAFRAHQNIKACSPKGIIHQPRTGLYFYRWVIERLESIHFF